MSSIQKRNEYVERFRSAFSAGVDGIVKAAGIYVEALDENPKNADVFRDEFQDWIPATSWSGFEAVGRKWMHPRLLMGGGGNYSNRIKRLPYSAQERIFDGDRFELLTTSGDTMKVDVRNITKEQADQLFDGSHIRSLAQQKAYLESRKPIATPEITVEEVLPYSIRAGRVHFRKDCVMTREQIRTLALQI